MHEDTFQQLLNDLRDGPIAIERQMRTVPAERWDDPVYEGSDGFTRRRLLAHIAANDQRQVTRVRLGSGIGNAADEAAMAEQGDVDVWNRAQVNARAGRSVDDLLAEMHACRAELVSLLESLTPEQRSRQMPFRDQRLPLTEMVPILLDHLAGHARDIASLDPA
jgi:hypothetical protein